MASFGSCHTCNKCMWHSQTTSWKHLQLKQRMGLLKHNDIMANVVMAKDWDVTLYCSSFSHWWPDQIVKVVLFMENVVMAKDWDVTLYCSSFSHWWPDQIVKVVLFHHRNLLLHIVLSSSTNLFFGKQQNEYYLAFQSIKVYWINMKSVHYHMKSHESVH